MLFASEQISASILHLYGQTLPSGSEGSHQKKTKKLFLGNEAEKLAPDEARKRLGKLVEEMDEDQDEQLTVTELTVWIEKRQKEQVKREADREWGVRNPAMKEL